MIPADSIKALYTAESPRSFDADLHAHLSHGYVYSTPRYLLMARPVCSRAGVEQINNVHHQFESHEWDTWYLYAFALREKESLRGLVKNLLTHMPFYLPLLAWERRGQPLTFYCTINLYQKYAKLHLLQN